jgi:hypothetical protein
MKSVTWAKMAFVGVTMCVGGPALVYYVQPTEEELFKVNHQPTQSLRSYVLTQPSATIRNSKNDLWSAARRSKRTLTSLSPV